MPAFSLEKKIKPNRGNQELLFFNQKCTYVELET
jgi:hypothetical protein